MDGGDDPLDQASSNSPQGCLQRSGSFRGVIMLAGLELAVLGIGTARRRYDTRVYARIYTDVAETQATKTHLPVTKRAARLQLGRELVDFFEWHLPQLAASLIGIAAGSRGRRYGLSCAFDAKKTINSLQISLPL